MDGNYIKELSKDSFSSVGLLHLNKISMKDCKIQKIDDNAFSKLKILTHINLDRNNISKLPAKLFDGNERLQSIILSNNQISSLVANQFPPLRALKKIDLSNSELRTINVKSFLNLGESLETVNLHGNQLQTVKEKTFTHLIGLKVINGLVIWAVIWCQKVTFVSLTSWRLCQCGVYWVSFSQWLGLPHCWLILTINFSLG